MSNGKNSRRIEEKAAPNWTGEAAWSVLLSRLQNIQYPLALALFSTLLTFCFGVCAFLVLENKMPPAGWLEIWNRWDAPHYLDIAELGYPHETGAREFLIVLLPVYPLAIRFAHSIIREWHVAALLVANVCCAGGLRLFFSAQPIGVQPADGAVGRILLIDFSNRLFSPHRPLGKHLQLCRGTGYATW